MKKITVVIIISFILSVANVNARETYCQNVNKTGTVVNAESLAVSMNKWLSNRGVNYTTSTQEMRNTIKNFCHKNSYATSEDATNHLNNIVDALSSMGQ